MNGKIEDIFKDKTVIHLDTCSIIYLMEENKTYLPLVKEVFSKIDRGFVSGISSFITLIELLIRPLQENNNDLANIYRDRLIKSPCFTLYPVERKVSEKAAALRAKYGPKNLKTPDAIQVATAISFGAQLFISNDFALKKIKEIEVLILDEYI